MALNGCCYQSNESILNILDQCVCDLKLGGILSLSDGTIYRRIHLSEPCHISDFVVESFTEIVISDPFQIIDEDTNTQVIEDTNTIEFIGQNGFMESISSVNTVTLNALTISGAGAPSGSPSPSTVMWFYADTTNNILYIWNVSTLTWFNYTAVITGNPLPVCDFSFTYRGITATCNANGSTTTQVGNSLSYSWSVSPSSGVTISTATSSTTDITFPDVGEYIITLVVTDTTTSQTANKSRVVMIDRILNVLGNIPNENTFTRLADAVNWWKDSAQNPDVTANGAKYRIFINGKTVEQNTGTSTWKLEQITSTYTPYFFFNEGGQVQHITVQFAATNNTVGSEYNIFVGARSQTNPINNWDGSFAGRPSLASAGTFAVNDTTYHNIYFDNLWMQSINFGSGTSLLAFRTGLNAKQEYYFNIKVTGNSGGIASNSAGSRSQTFFKDCRIAFCNIDTIGTSLNGEDENYFQIYHSYANTDHLAFDHSNIYSTTFNSYFESSMNASYLPGTITYPYTTLRLRTHLGGKSFVVGNTIIDTSTNVRQDQGALGISANSSTGEQVFVFNNYCYSVNNSALNEAIITQTRLFNVNNFYKGVIWLSFWGVGGVGSSPTSTANYTLMKLFHCVTIGTINAGATRTYAASTLLANKNVSFTYASP